MSRGPTRRMNGFASIAVQTKLSLAWIPRLRCPLLYRLGNRSALPLQLLRSNLSQPTPPNPIRLTLPSLARLILPILMLLLSNPTRLSLPNPSQPLCAVPVGSLLPGPSLLLWLPARSRRKPQNRPLFRRRRLVGPLPYPRRPRPRGPGKDPQRRQRSQQSAVRIKCPLILVRWSDCRWRFASIFQKACM